VPELPEVENVLRTLAPRVSGRRIVEVHFLSALVAGGLPDELSGRLRGEKIHGVRRHGKHLLLDLDHGLLDIHLRMTGKIRFGDETATHTRAILQLDGVTMRFDDVRQFGRWVWREADPPLGPDALDLGADQFIALIAARRGRIKSVLLNQDVLSGLGNIYVDESLFRSGIHPLARGLSRPRLKRLFSEVQDVLAEAIRQGGSSISDYVDAEGRRGRFQDRHLVYGRAGEPCPTCGKPIRRIVVGQRGTHFCPQCQRR
jgi:formamidopyrimidine-DNA glycosylase